MCDEGVELKELTHVGFDLGNLTVIKYLLVPCMHFYMEINVRGSKYSTIVFLQRCSSDPNCSFGSTDGFLSAHPTVSEIERKISLLRGSAPALARWSGPVRESPQRCLRCAGPQRRAVDPGEGTSHQGDASSTRARNKLQDYLPVLLCGHQQMTASVTIFCTCWPARVKGAVQVSTAIFMDMWGRKNDVSAIVTSFLHGHSESQGHFNSWWGSLWRATFQSTFWESLCRHFGLFVR